MNPTPMEPPARLEMLPAERVQVANFLFENFAIATSKTLSEKLLLSTQIEVGDPADGLLSNIFLGYNQPFSTIGLDLHPFAGYAFLAFDQALLGAALEALLGAPKRLGGVKREFLTTVELQVLDNFLDAVVEELRKTWLPYCGSTFQRSSQEPWQVAAENDVPVLLMTGFMTLCGTSGRIQLLVPTGFLRQDSFRPRERDLLEIEARRRLFEESLGEIPIHLEAVFPDAPFRLEEISKIKPGVTMRLPFRVKTPVLLRVNGSDKFCGHLKDGEYSLHLEIEGLTGECSTQKGPTGPLEAQTI